jgi:hypothetical protein
MTINTERPIAFRFLTQCLLSGTIALIPALAWSEPPGGEWTVAPIQLSVPYKPTHSWDLPINLHLLETNADGWADVAAEWPVGELRTAPRGNELTALARVEFERADRHFRAEVVEWFAQRSVAAGIVTDVLVRGSDRGVHLHVRNGGQYLLLWETRF